jgi:hypothetical protein
MPDYPFEHQLVVDPNNPANVVSNASVYIYDPEDEGGTTPLDLTDPYGFGIAQPLISNALGFVVPFVAQLPQVMWRAGAYSGYLNSYKGLRDEAVAAADAAEESADMAEATANGFTVGTVTTGIPAAASFTGTAPNRVLHLTIPPGATGPAGEDGADGHNPITVSATEPPSPAEGDIWFDIS